jgi:CHAT domain-containing protein/tetratricopeptide (TPR) repeat protein
MLSASAVCLLATIATAAQPAASQDPALDARIVQVTRAGLTARSAGNLSDHLAATRERVHLLTQRHGHDHPRVQSAARDLECVLWVQALPAAERSAWVEADRECRAAYDLSDERDFGAAAAKFTHAISVMERIAGPESLFLSEPLSDLAAALANGIRRQESLSVQQRRLAILRLHLPANDFAVLRAESNVTVGRYLATGDATLLPSIVAQSIECLRRSQETTGVDATHDMEKIAVTLQRQGHLELAEATYRRAIQAVENDPDPAARKRVVYLLGLLAQHLLQQHRIEDAEAAQRRAMLEEDRLGVQPFARTAPLGMSDILLAREQPDQAIDLLNDLREQRRGRDASDPEIALVILQNLAVCYSRKGEFTQARTYAEEAVAGTKAAYGHKHLRVGQRLINLGVIAVGQKDLRVAVGSFAEAVDVLRFAAGDMYRDTIGARVWLATALARAGEPDRSRAEWRATARAVEVARVRATTQGSDRAFLASHLAMRVLACDAAKSRQPEQAWRWLEASEGREVLDDVSWRSRVTLSDADRSRERALEERCRHLDEAAGVLVEKATQGDAAVEQIQLLRQQQSDAWLDLKALRNDLASRHGAAAGEPFDVVRVQAQIPPDTALVAWVHTGVGRRVGPDWVCWACVVRHTGAPRWVPMRSVKADGWGRDDHQAVFDAGEAIEAGADVTQLAAIRHRLVDPLLPELDGARNVVVTGGGQLARFPLELLFPDHIVSYAPSATLYAWYRERAPLPQAGAEASLLALGNPVFRTAMALPNSGREIEAIARMFAGVVVLQGSAANEAGVQALLAGTNPAPYDYLHFATHGVFTSRKAHILLAEPPPMDFDRLVAAGGLVHDGRIDTNQVLQTWRLNSDLVVLSACRSGDAEPGHIDFAQALLTAGARSVVLSLWDVNDVATTLLMVRFYENLLGVARATRGEGAGLGAMSKAEALDEAKRWLRALAAEEIDALVTTLGMQAGGEATRDWKTKVKAVSASTDNKEAPAAPFAHPVFWAAFVLVGDPR